MAKMDAMVQLHQEGVTLTSLESLRHIRMPRSCSASRQQRGPCTVARSWCLPKGTEKAVPPGKRDCDTIWTLEDFLIKDLLTIETFLLEQKQDFNFPIQLLKNTGPLKTNSIFFHVEKFKDHHYRCPTFSGAGYTFGSRNLGPSPVSLHLLVTKIKHIQLGDPISLL